MVTTLLAFVLAAALPAQQKTASGLAAIVPPYLDIQQALAADKTDGVTQAAGAIASAAAALGAPGEAIARHAAVLQKSTDLPAMRTAFGDLSEAVIALAKADDWSGLADVKVSYCPMAKHNWLQRDAEIRNPYYGKAMLGCGSFKDK